MKREIDNHFIMAQIDYYLKKKGWTKYELTNQTALSSGTIYEWYNNHFAPSLKNIQTICEAFGISLSEFFSTTKEEQLGAYEDKLFALCSQMTDAQKESLLIIAQTLLNGGNR